MLPEDFSLSVEESNPMFNDVSFFSYPVQIPLKGNLAALKNIGNRDSAMRSMELEHDEVRINAEGLPLNVGQVIVSDGEEVDKTFSFNIDAQQQSFSELISNLRCRDVRLKDRFFMGKQIGEIKCDYQLVAHGEKIEQTYDPTTKEVLDYKTTFTDMVAMKSPTSGQIIREPQPLGFAQFTGFNVTQAYPNAAYCNIRVAYAHPGVKTNDDGTQETDGYVKGNDHNPVGAQYDDYGQYWLLDAVRQQGGICFYVLYFLDCLFEQLGVTFDNSELLEVEDLKRLCFITTQFHVDLEDTGEQLNSIYEINEKLRQWGCSTEFAPYITLGSNRKVYFSPSMGDWEETIKKDVKERIFVVDSGTLHVLVLDITSFKRKISSARITVRSGIYNMWANSDNFPDADVSAVISSLENSFGIRFLYDPEKRHVTAKLLRNVYKSRVPRHFNGKVIGMTPMTEKITGVRVKYSAESDQREQRDNVRYEKRDYDTEFDYIDYPEDRTVVNLHYMDIVKQVSATNNNVYIDKTTGNTYRVKIDSEADNSMSLHPVLYQVGQFKGVEIGDCSERNEEYVKELVSDFRPMSINVINAKGYQKLGEAPILAAFLDVDMEHEWLPKRLSNTLAYNEDTKNLVLYDSDGNKVNYFPEGVDVSLVQIMRLGENYDPSDTDEGNSPLQDIDWGLTIGIMRGGGNNSEIAHYDNNYDGFGNDRWMQTVGTYATTSDSLTPKGEGFDYNGSAEGLGGEHFSLQIRSFAPFVYYIDGNGKMHINKDLSLEGQPVAAGSTVRWQIPCDPDVYNEQGQVTMKVRSRGLFDTFISPHAHFLLNRKPFKIPVEATLAQLLDIRNHWTDLWEIDGKVGFINRVKYDINVTTGVQVAEISFYAI